MSNYPPGVTGREPQITGEARCADCGCVMAEDAECPVCGEPMRLVNGDSWLCSCGERRSAEACVGGCPEPDWDAERDRRAEAGR